MLCRIAPTPSGFLHEGNILNFLLSWNWAKKNQAKILLRIDDCDSTRFRNEYLEDIFETLKWLGMDWDIGPKNLKDFQNRWSQSLRKKRYLEVLKRVKGTYYCECSRSFIRKNSRDGIYPSICKAKDLSKESESLATRISIPQGLTLSKSMGDFIIWRKGDLPSYHLVSIVDDVDFGVTHVFRGEDLKESTQAQGFLAMKAGLNSYSNIQFFHHPLVEDSNGVKLSKSVQSHNHRPLRERYSSLPHLLDFLAPYFIHLKGPSNSLGHHFLKQLGV